MVSTLIQNAPGSATSAKACRCCGDEVVRNSSRHPYCQECHLELVFGIIPQPDSSAREVRSAALLAERQYHGDQFHTAEW